MYTLKLFKKIINIRTGLAPKTDPSTKNTADTEESPKNTFINFGFIIAMCVCGMIPSVFAYNAAIAKTKKGRCFSLFLLGVICAVSILPIINAIRLPVEALTIDLPSSLTYTIWPHASPMQALDTNTSANLFLSACSTILMILMLPSAYCAIIIRNEKTPRSTRIKAGAVFAIIAATGLWFGQAKKHYTTEFHTNPITWTSDESVRLINSDDMARKHIIKDIVSRSGLIMPETEQDKNPATNHKSKLKILMQTLLLEKNHD